MTSQVGVTSKWTNDSQCFLLEHFDTIEDSPSHIYHSALPILPSSSWLQDCYSVESSLRVKVVKGLPAGWGMCSRTVMLDDHTSALSHHNTIAIGSLPGDIIILNAITGSQAAVLSGHTDEVVTLTFSPDGTSLVSGGLDKTVKLWDMQTGGVVKTFFGHTEGVYSVSISADCITIASGSEDKTICLWDIQTGECYCVIQQQSYVSHVSFSPTDPQHLISISNDKLWQWDTNGHQIRLPCDGIYTASSSDGNQFVSCSLTAATVQNSNSGVIVAEFQLPYTYAHQCCFSPNGRLVAVTTGSIIYIWDISTSDPHLVETFIGHTHYIFSLTFSSSSSLISTSRDKSIKFWQIGASSVNPVITSPGSTPNTLPLISSISLQARDGIAISSGADGVKTWDIPASLCEASSQTLAKDYKIGDIKLTNSRLVFVWYIDEKISIWDPEKEKFLLQKHIAGHKVLDLRISGDGSKIFCITERFIQTWDIWTGEVIGKVDCPPSSLGVKFLAMESSRVWIEVYEIEGWDFGIPDSPPVKLSTIPSNILYLNDAKMWDSSLCRIQDTVTGKVVFQLPARFQGHVVEVQWNSQYLAISLESEKELILEFHPAFLQ